VNSFWVKPVVKFPVESEEVKGNNGTSLMRNSANQLNYSRIIFM